MIHQKGEVQSKIFDAQGLHAQSGGVRQAAIHV